MHPRHPAEYPLEAPCVQAAHLAPGIQGATDRSAQLVTGVGRRENNTAGHFLQFRRTTAGKVCADQISGSTTSVLISCFGFKKRGPPDTCMNILAALSILSARTNTKTI